MVLELLASLPLWYWVGGALTLLLFTGESLEEIRDALLALLYVLFTLVILVLVVTLWPLALAVSIIQKNLGHWRGPDRAHHTPEWFLARWTKWPRTFGQVRGRWMVTGQWFPRPTACPVEFVPRRASIVGGWTIRAHLLIVELGVTRLPAGEGA